MFLVFPTESLLLGILGRGGTAAVAFVVEGFGRGLAEDASTLDALSVLNCFIICSSISLVVRFAILVCLKVVTMARSISRVLRFGCLRMADSRGSEPLPPGGVFCVMFVATAATFFFLL